MSYRTRELRKEIERYLNNIQHTTFEKATNKEMYKAIATVVNSTLSGMRMDFNEHKSKVEVSRSDCKKVCYICMEFLMGRSLKNNLYNLGITDDVEELLEERNMDLNDLYELEPDAGLGNGGLGRLAACFMDALTAGGYDATGYSLLYEYGLFKQKIVDSWQVELPDNWLPGGRVWLNPREDDVFNVDFYGDFVVSGSDKGLKCELRNPQRIEAVPYELYISGADTEAVNVLRLWKARNSEGFDMELFNNGDFTLAAQKNSAAETITKVLYPADHFEEGKELRLKQQYFMVSASCQNIVRNQFRLHGTLDNFHEKTVIHINDTHPALVIPELMRIFMDDYGYEWDDAWNIVTKTVSYTNHTILAEALEKWSADIVRSMLPRIFAIIEEINRRFRLDMEKIFPGDKGKIDYMAILDGRQIRMANMSVIGSHKVNGVSELHSQILRQDLFHDYYLATPEKFVNVTNGIAYRRWLCQANPELAALLDSCIGKGYRKYPSELERFDTFRNDPSVHSELDRIKLNNKIRLSNMVKKSMGISIDPHSIFITQAKRLHEYKRQLLNALRIIDRYLLLKNDPNADVQPETYLFAAKAAPSYFLAKEIIQLICKIAEDVNSDPALRGKMSVVFLENYSVSMAETLLPATEISEQISLAGKEASGTGNMKMMINGALTIGTLDGANVEMLEAVGDDNIYIFGQTSTEVLRNLADGYDSMEIYKTNDRIKAVLDKMASGFGGMEFTKMRDYLIKPSYSIADPYMCLKDFDDYCKTHDEMEKAYADRSGWNEKSVRNIAMAARFAADRSIADYARDIWYTKPVL